MSQNKPHQLYVIVEEPVVEEPVTRDGERSGRDTGGGYGRAPASRVEAQAQAFKRKRIAVSVDRLKGQMQDLIAVVNELLDPATASVAESAGNGLQLDAVTLSVEVNAEGELSLLGTGGKLGGSGGITLTFSRAKP